MLFAPKRIDPVQQVREWKRKLNAEKRALDREVLALDRSEKKIILEIRNAAKRNDKVSAKTLAKEIVHSRKAKDKLYCAKAHLNSVVMQLQSNLATAKIAGCLQQSTVVMASMNEMIKLPQLHRTMMDMAKEMEKAGLIQEMMDDMFEDMEEEGVEEEAEEEIEKVFLEITHGILDKGGRVGTKLPTKLTKEEAELQEALSSLPSTA